jgi:hypothetical protein
MIGRLGRVFTFKVFILVLQFVMFTSLMSVLRRSSTYLSTTERILQIILLVFLACFELILLLPPFIARFNILRIQVNLIQLVLIFVFLLLTMGIAVLVKSKVANK